MPAQDPLSLMMVMVIVMIPDGIDSGAHCIPFHLGRSMKCSETELSVELLPFSKLALKQKRFLLRSTVRNGSGSTRCSVSEHFIDPMR